MKRSQDVFGFGAQATPHDLRRTCASNLAALGFSRVVQDKVLNHVAKDRSSIAGVYDRHAYAVEKRQALEAWGKRLATVLDERAQDGNILPFHRQPVAEAC
jgi:integrase